MQLAGMDAEQRAVRPGKDGEGQRVDVDTERGRGFPGLALPHEDRVVEGLFTGELLYRLTLIDRDADDLDVWSSRLKGFQHRDLAQARATPGRPEVDQHGLAAEALDRLRLTRQICEREIGQGV